MRNERGLTLVELLAVLALVGVISALIMGVFFNGIKAADRSTTKQMLQQEANYITEVVRNEYLKSVDKNIIELKIEDDNHILKMNSKTISEGFEYFFEEPKDQDEEGLLTTIFLNPEKELVPFGLTIEKNNQSYLIETIFSKLE